MVHWNLFLIAVLLYLKYSSYPRFLNCTYSKKKKISMKQQQKKIVWEHIKRCNCVYYSYVGPFFIYDRMIKKSPPPMPKTFGLPTLTRVSKRPKLFIRHVGGEKLSCQMKGRCMVSVWCAPMHSWAKRKKPAKIWIQKIRKIGQSYLCLQQFDTFWLWSACNVRKRNIAR